MRCNRMGVNPFIATFAACAILIALGRDTAIAQVKITEIWPNGAAGGTSDWFELTNIGSTAIDPSSYFYSDNHFDPTESSALTGISNLGPGESAIYLVSWHDLFPEDPAGAVAEFNAVWQTNGAYQVGYLLQPGDASTDPPTPPEGGHGLSGGGGDTVNVYDGNFALSTLLATLEYPADSLNNDATWVVNPADSSLQYAAVGFDGGFTAAAGTPVGSPGRYNVPEPSSIAMLILSVVGVSSAWRRR
jgi:PEP-CTERM motif